MDQIFDTHVHFWDTDLLDYAWLNSEPALNRPFLPADFDQASGRHPIRKKLFVQADCAPNQALAEVEWVSELAKQDQSIQGIVAFAPLEFGEQAAVYLAGLSRFPLVKGIRRLIQSESAGFAKTPGFIAGVQQLANHNFSFDICIKHHQMEDVLELVSHCPQIQFVLDHIGKPDIKNRLFEPWKSNINALSRYPNVMCKLSGLVTEADHQNWTTDDLTPYINHVFEAFGPNRIMFGSDWPVCSLASSYERWLDTAIKATGHLSQEEKEAVFFNNGENFYKLAN